MVWLEDLGCYGYDAVLSEKFELVFNCWVDAAALLAWLATRDPAGSSSDKPSDSSAATRVKALAGKTAPIIKRHLDEVRRIGGARLKTPA